MALFQDLDSDETEYHMPKKSEGHAIRKSHVNSQTQCHLFRLPAELRNRIYDYVIGSGTIHVDLRICAPIDRIVLREFQWEGDEPWGEVCKKFTYAVCQIPGHWAECRARSKNSEIKRYHDCNELTDPHINSCTSDPFLDLAYNYHISRVDRKAHFDRLRATRRRHAKSAVDLKLLQTCRMIYHEAWKLPFENYTFSMPQTEMEQEKDRLQEFSKRILFPHQAQAVRSLHLSGGEGSKELCSAIRCFPNVKRLQYVASTTYSPSSETEEDWKSWFDVNKVESVEVIISGEASQDKATRTAQMEAFLVKLSAAEKWDDRLKTGLAKGVCEVLMHQEWYRKAMETNRRLGIQ